MGILDRILNAVLNIHPWHSLMVHFPTAFATVGLLCILYALWRRSELFEKFAFFCMAVTAAGTALSGVAGLRDNAVHFGGGAPYLNLKIYLGISLLLLSAASGIARWRKPDLLWDPSTRILCIAGYVGAFLLATVLGFVGGSIVYGF